MSFTGKRYGLNIDFFHDERRDPIKATHASAAYLKDLYNLFGSWELAAAGYNAGEGKIARAIRRYGTKNFWHLSKHRYLKPETKNYVPKIMALAIIGKNLKAFGFDDITFDETLDYEVIETQGSVDLYSVADALGTSFEEIKRYNPELTRWQTPITAETYNLKVPVGLKKKWNQLTDKTIVSASRFKTYQTRGYSELNHVSRITRVPVEVLAHLNQMAPNQRLFPNTLVLLPFREDHSEKDHMYADLYQKSRRHRGKRGSQYHNWLDRGYAKGQQISRPREYYVVQKGDTLWDVARKTGVSINTIIKSNYRLVKNRMIIPGDKLAIR
jgi:membrane-bound lytic murein transglycosylase D